MSTFVVFLAATTMLNLSPGPDMLYVISSSLGQGKQAGIVSAFGIGAGTLVHTFIAAIGLSALLLSFPAAFEIVKYAGAAYLVFLGLRMLIKSREKINQVSLVSASRSNLWSVFRQGIITNVLNPKVALFFLAFLPQFISRAKGALPVQFILLGLIFDISGTSWNILIATMAGHASDMLKRRSSFSTLQRLLPGLILVGLGILVAVR